MKKYIRKPEQKIRDAERLKKLNLYRKENGLCFKCGKPAVINKKSCQECLTTRAKYRRKNRLAIRKYARQNSHKYYSAVDATKKSAEFRKKNPDYYRKRYHKDIKKSRRYSKKTYLRNKAKFAERQAARYKAKKEHCLSCSAIMNQRNKEYCRNKVNAANEQLRVINEKIRLGILRELKEAKA